MVADNQALYSARHAAERLRAPRHRGINGADRRLREKESQSAGRENAVLRSGAQTPGFQPDALRASSASPFATDVSSSPLLSRAAPKRPSKSRFTAGTSDVPPVIKTLSTSSNE